MATLRKACQELFGERLMKTFRFSKHLRRFVASSKGTSVEEWIAREISA